MGCIVFLLLIPVAACSQVFLPVDCNDLYHRGFGHSGVYSIYPAGPVSPVQVYCDMGCVDKPEGGLENIHLLSLRKSYELRIEMEDFEGIKAYVHYSSFSVGPEQEGYRLNFSCFKDGGAGNSLSEHNGQKFSTFDNDQDTHSSNCAKTYLGGWWYGECHSVNPNGMYLWGSSTYGIGINWVSFKGFEYSLKAITIKIVPKD
ncbi:hypothetical protein PAMP_009006 [Pampus punctatissimus]